MVVADAPVAGDVVYGWSSWRYMLAMATLGLVAAAVGWLFSSLLLSALAGQPALPVTAQGLLFVPIYAVLLALFSWRFSHARQAGLRFVGVGIELAAERRDVLVVPGAAVTSARIRWVWPVAMLDVFVASGAESQVLRLDRGGRPPLRKRTGDQLRFSMPIAGLRPSATEIRSALRRRGLSE